MPDKDPLPLVDNFSELGATGLWRTGGFVIDDILPQLRGRQALTAFRDMSENDPIIGSILFAIERVILQVDWRVDPYDDASGTTPAAADLETAAFVQECMDDMSHSWHELMIAILSFLPFGWSFFEIVYKQRKGPDQKDPAMRSKFNDNKVGWRKIAMRAQDSLWQWQFDESGGIKAMIQRDPTTGHLNVIPIEKGLLFRTTSARGNPEGRSVLRNSFKSWYYKRRIEEFEAIGVERDLAGLPVGKVPAEWMMNSATAGEKASLYAMERIVRGVKRNESEGIILPLMYDDDGNELVQFELLTSGGTRQFDTDKIITRYNQQIAMTVLADFIMLGHESVGSFALGSSKVDLFVAAVESWIRLIAEVFNSHAIPRLLSLNGMDTSRPPNLTYGQVQAVDLVELGTFLFNLSQAELLTPDNNLEDHLRELAGLPAFRAEANGVADNSRYGENMKTPGAVMTEKDGFVAASPDKVGGGTSDTKTTPNRSKTGGAPHPNANGDQTGGSDLQANISSSGYPGEDRSNGSSGPLTNNQGSTS